VLKGQENTYGDGDGRGSDDLAGLALLVDFAQTSPFAELLVVIDLQEVDAVLSTEGLDELDVLGLLAVGGENAEERLAPEGCHRQKIELVVRNIYSMSTQNKHVEKPIAKKSTRRHPKRIISDDSCVDYQYRQSRAEATPRTRDISGGRCTNTENSLVKHLDDLVQTAGQTVVDQGGLEHLLQSSEHVHGLLDSGCLGAAFTVHARARVTAGAALGASWLCNPGKTHGISRQTQYSSSIKQGLTGQWYP
jgi:hypothetical protein